MLASALASGEEGREGEGEGTSTAIIYQWPWPCKGVLFSPSDEELVDHYLYLIKNNTNAKIDPWGIIREFDVYSMDPWDLPGDFLHGPNKNQELFFTPRRCKSARGNGSRVDRTAGSGYWHGNSTTQIHCSSSGLVASKTSLTFKIKDARNAGKWVGTDWIMQEYLLLSPDIGIAKGKGNGFGFQPKALCKVYDKKNKRKKGMQQVEEGSWSLPLPPPSKRARIEGEDEEEGDVGLPLATAVHQETEGEEGNVASASGAAVHHQETEEEEEGNVGSAVHQQPMSHLESPSAASTAQEAAAQPQGMEAFAQSSDVFSSLDDICSLDEIYCLTFQNSPNEMEAEAQFQISEEASAASDVCPPLDSPPPNSHFTLIDQNKEMEAQAQTHTQVEVSDVFPPLDDIYCAPPSSNFALADQPLWDWDWDSFSFGVGGDMGMYSACGFAQEAPQLLPPHSHCSNPVNAA